jgi:hypothetical protein
MERILLLAAIGIMIPLCAWSQVKHGTVVVAYATENGVTVAADSRGIIGGQRDVDDNVCKISTLGNQLIVGLAGIKGHIESGGRWSWDVLAIAQNIFTGLKYKSTSDDLPYAFSVAWGKALENQFSRELRLRPNDTLANKSKDEGPTLASGIVTGRAKAGNIVIYIVKINYSPLRSGQFSVHSELTPFAPPGTVTLGRAEISNEITSGVTARGIQWRNELTAQNMRSSARMRDAIPAIRIVELSISYLPIRPPLTINDVGGPVDAVKLTPDGKIDWIQRKQYCQGQ